MELIREKLSVDRLTLRQKEGFISTNPAGYNAFGVEYERVLPASRTAKVQTVKKLRASTHRI